MLDKLPNEITLNILNLTNDWENYRQLRYVNRQWFKLFNVFYKIKASKLIDVEKIDHSLIRQYQETFKFWNGPLSNLLDPDISWYLVLSLLTRRRLYFERKNYQVLRYTRRSVKNLSFQPISKFNEGSMRLKLNHLYSLNYKTTVLLPKGVYYLQIALINHERVKRGFGFPNFRASVNRNKCTSHLLTDIDPGKVTIIDTSVKFRVIKELENVEIVIDEGRLKPHQDLEFLFIQLNPYKEFDVDGDLNEPLLYTIPNYSVNRLEKLCYMNLQNMSPISEPEEEINYTWFEKCYRWCEKYFTTDERIPGPGEEIDYKWYENYYTTDGERNDFRIQDHSEIEVKELERGSSSALVPWKVPF